MPLASTLMPPRSPRHSASADRQRARLEARIRRQYQTLCETYHFGDLVVQLTRVVEPDEMLERMELDVASGAAAVPRWQPYWAELWGCSLAVCDLLVQHELPGVRVLDLGCGPGYEAKRLHSLGAEVTGVDISAESIRIASSRNPECRFMKMDFFAIDDSVGRFNAVWASGAFIHVPPETMGRVLRSIRNLLLEQGLLAVILRDGSGSVVSHPVVDGASIERIVYRYTQREFTEYCRAAGLAFLRDGVLDTSLREAGWRCYFFIRE